MNYLLKYYDTKPIGSSLSVDETDETLRVKVHIDGQLNEIHVNNNLEVSIQVSRKTMKIVCDSHLFAILREELTFTEKRYNTNPRKRKHETYIQYERMFLKKSGKCSVGFLRHVTSFLKRKGITFICLTDYLPTVKPDLITSVGNLKLRDYQVTALKSIMFYRFGVIKAATNAGKTALSAIVLANFMREFNDETTSVVIVPSKDIFIQTITFFKECFGEDLIGFAGDGKFKLNRIMICIANTFSRKSDLIPNIGIIIVDEVHSFGNVTGKSIAKYDVPIIGMSGTPFSSSSCIKNADIRSMFGDVIYEITNKELVERGVSAKGEILFLQFDMEFQYSDYLLEYEMKTGEVQFHSREEEAIICNTERNEKLCEVASSSIKEGKQVIMLVKRIEHGEKLLKLMDERGLGDTLLLQGKNTLKQRQKVINSFKDGELFCIIATTIFEVGISIDEIDIIINCGGGKSSIKTLQRLGRILRSRDNKKFIFYDTDDKFANPFHRHSMERRKSYRKESAWNVKIIKD